MIRVTYNTHKRSWKVSTTVWILSRAGVSSYPFRTTNNIPTPSIKYLITPLRISFEPVDERSFYLYISSSSHERKWFPALRDETRVTLWRTHAYVARGVTRRAITSRVSQILSELFSVEICHGTSSFATESGIFRSYLFFNSPREPFLFWNCARFGSVVSKVGGQIRFPRQNGRRFLICSLEYHWLTSIQTRRSS